MKWSATIGFLILGIYSCVEPYKIIPVETERVIVVDASLTNETKPHITRLSYTFPIDESVEIPLSGAEVTIEDEDGAVIQLSEVSPGQYQTDSSFAGVVGKKYMLQIVTPDNLVIFSAEEELLAPSPIDSIYGRYISLPHPETGILRNGIQFYVDTHSDLYPSSNYRYEYVERYELRVPFPSEYVWSDESRDYTSRFPPVGICYASEKSNELIHGTTQGLTENRLSELPVRFIEDIDPHLYYRYSLEIRQYMIGSATYKFHKKLKEINEAGGSFFDRQKGTVFGNLTAENSEDIVILGFFEVAGVSDSKRVFRPSEFSPEGFEIHKTDFCWSNANEDVFDTVALGGLYDFFSFFSNRNKNIYTILPFPIDMAVVAPVGCSDCTFWEGDLNKPEFWN